MVVILSAAICIALILAGCVAISQVLEATSLPPGIRAAWIVAIIVSPLMGPVLWMRTSRGSDERSISAGTSRHLVRSETWPS